MTLSSPRFEGERLKLLVAFALISTAGMWLNIMYYTWFAGPLGWKYPDDTFQQVQVSRFSDFYDVVETVHMRDPYGIRPPPVPPPRILKNGYPPLANATFYLLSHFDIDYPEIGTAGISKGRDWALWLYLAVPFFSFPVIVLFWLKAPLPWLTALLVICGFNLAYPMTFAMDRGNLELFVFILITVYAWLTDCPSPISRWTAVAAIALAAALKIYPLIFALIYLKQKRWREASGVILLAAGVTLVSYLIFRGGILGNIAANWANLKQVKVLMAGNIQWATNHSSGLFSLIFLSLAYVFHCQQSAVWFHAHYMPVLELFSASAVLLIAVRKLSFARILTATCCLAILATPESPDYKLLLLFPSTIALIAEGGGTRVFNLFFVAIVGLLFVAKNWVMVFAQVSYGSIINPLLVLLLLALVIFFPAPREVTLFGFLLSRRTQSRRRVSSI